MASVASRIDAYLRKHGSPLAGLGSAFVAAGKQHGVDPLLLVAFTGAETSFGAYGPSQRIKNPFGWGPGKEFPDYKTAINTVASGLRRYYLDEGLKTIDQIGAKWAPVGAGNDPTNLNSNWSANVRKFYGQLGGSGSLAKQASKTAAAVAAVPVATSSAVAGASPDLAGHALRDLNHMAAGTYDPAFSLADLVDTVRATPSTSLSIPSLTPSGSKTTKTPSGGITYSGQPSTHPTDGLPGYPARDIFAPAGTPFLAPEDGEVIRLSGRGGTSGNVYGYSVYFKGKSGKTYYITHLGESRPPVGAKLQKGQELGTVSPWNSGSTHAHVGIKEK